MANNPGNPGKATPTPKPSDQPTGVREPSNTRSPSQPTPDEPQKPYSANREEDEEKDERQDERPTDAQTEGM